MYADKIETIKIIGIKITTHTLQRLKIQSYNQVSKYILDLTFKQHNFFYKNIK